MTVDGYAVGDYEAAFARLYGRAYDVAFKLLGYRAEAEDVAQETLARAYIHWPKVHSYAEPWTVRVAGNLAIGSWRKNRRLASFAAHDDGTADDAGGVAFTAERLELRRALGQLSKRQREVVVLRHLAGFSERETAEVLGCSTGSVKQHGSRGLAALRAHLSVGDDGPEGGAVAEDPDGPASGQVGGQVGGPVGGQLTGWSADPAARRGAVPRGSLGGPEATPGGRDTGQDVPSVERS